MPCVLVELQRRRGMEQLGLEGLPNQRRKRGRRAGRKVKDMIDDQGS